MPKRRDVAAPPIQTSLQRISTSGRILKIAANNTVVMTNETAMSTIGQTASSTGSLAMRYVFVAERTRRIVIETSRSEQTVSTSTKESRRLRKDSAKPLRLGATFQMVFIAF